jgi:hypothetical protein
MRVAWNGIIAVGIGHTYILALKFAQVTGVGSRQLCQILLSRSLKNILKDTYEQDLSISEFQEMIWAKVTSLLLMMFQHVSPGWTE